MVAHQRPDLAPLDLSLAHRQICNVAVALHHTTCKKMQKRKHLRLQRRTSPSTLSTSPARSQPHATRLLFPPRTHPLGRSRDRCTLSSTMATSWPPSAVIAGPSQPHRGLLQPSSPALLSHIVASFSRHHLPFSATSWPPSAVIAGPLSHVVASLPCPVFVCHRRSSVCNGQGDSHVTLA